MNKPDMERYAAKTENPLTSAFEKKVATHASGSATMVPPPQIGQRLEQIKQMPREGKGAAYIHVPFCETHCLYCGFYKKKLSPDDSRAYTDAVLTELKMWKDEPAQNSAPIHAVYFGGGTPTSLEAVDLGRLVEGVRNYLPLANDCELTLEGRIQNFDEDKIRAVIDNGVNRFSLGVQTFDTALRQSMKRLADRKVVMDKLTELKNLDQAAVIIDLIYGFPGQTREMWEHDIRTFQELELDGADLYQLQVFPGTPLHGAIEHGKMEKELDVETRALLYDYGCELMEREQYRRLSVNHWGRTSRERNIYNHLMRSPAHCLSFGPGAGGNLNGYSMMAESDYMSWKEMVEQGRKPVKMLFQQGEHALLEKTITGEFELCRINPGRLGKEFNLDLAGCLEPLLSQWTEAKLLEKDGDWLRLTRAGQFWQVNIAQLTIDYLHQTILKENE